MPTIQDDPYSRLYHRLADEFPSVYDDPAMLGTYVQLLIQADQSWPTAPFLPAWVEPEWLAELTDCGLITITGKRYRVKGLDKERRRRRNAGRKGAAARWDNATAGADADALAHAVASAEAYANGMRRRDETSKDETSNRARSRTREGITPLKDVLRKEQ